jgi:hypothetical protein
MIFCNLNLQTPKRYSAQWRVGCLSLSLGLLLHVFLHPETQSWQIVSHFASELLIGISFGCFLIPTTCLARLNRKGDSSC